ncbi:hypothetical protein BH18ACT2_BH18ACT2_08060 [soil metagenome]
MKRHPPLTEPGVLPAELAAGPFTDRWLRPAGSYREAQAAWRRAGEEWSEANGLGRFGWVGLLSADVAYWAKSLGRAHARSLDGDYHPRYGPHDDPQPPHLRQ